MKTISRLLEKIQLNSLLIRVFFFALSSVFVPLVNIESVSLLYTIRWVYFIYQNVFMGSIYLKSLETLFLNKFLLSGFVVVFSFIFTAVCHQVQLLSKIVSPPTSVILPSSRIITSLALMVSLQEILWFLSRELFLLQFMVNFKREGKWVGQNCKVIRRGL